uniref:Latent transforming growth factor beta binding protein 4 n=1 Tax=Gopherus evgoodei TaxID=1825980 RepID=A0A8C4YKD8_9SAUR
ARADIDECENHLACPGQECVNSPGSFQCLPCRDGHRLRNGRYIDECLTGSPCGPHGRCSNTEGSFRCECSQGYRAGAPGDVNECLEGEFCFPHGECLNTDGSYTCLCAPGFAPVPSDVDECQEYGSALCGVQRCENQPGSYRCVPACEPGYRAGAAGSCVDVDECANRTLCGDHAMCHNLPGSFHCRCDQGYEIARDGRHCQDVNECETLQGVDTCTPSRDLPTTPHRTQLVSNTSELAHPYPDITRNGLGRIGHRGLLGGISPGRCPGLPISLGLPTPLCLAAQPPGRLPVPQPEPGAHVRDPSRQECYYQACEKVLARNATRQECCCSLGHAWGPACPAQPCPDPVEYQALCPRGNGYTVPPWSGRVSPPPDMDECALFSTQLCRGGVCVNKAPGYACYCPNGYYYETHHLECIGEPPPAQSLPPRPPPPSPSTQPLPPRPPPSAVCWQEVGPDLVCSRPRLDRQVTYTECCCLYGEAWGMDCALCPARDSGEGPNPQTLPAAGGPAVKWGAQRGGGQGPCSGGVSCRARARPRRPTPPCPSANAQGPPHSSPRPLLPTDIDECAEAEGPPALCLNGRCLNTDGSYRCLCPRGYVLSQPPPSCIPARPRA